MAKRTPELLPLSDVANMPPRSATASGTPDTLKSSRRSARSPKAASFAVPFPTIHEENIEPTSPASTSFTYDSKVEEARGREWALEISRRQQSIKELRDKKIRLEQTQAARTRKTVASPSTRYLNSPERKLTADDVDFIAALHASVVWRLWHAGLSPEVFASERLLATRLHLVLMRHGRKNIPVPPIVALSKPHHMTQSFSARHMMERDQPGIQSLPQLVAKSLLRQGSGKGRARRRGELGKVPASPLARGDASGGDS